MKIDVRKELRLTKIIIMMNDYQGKWLNRMEMMGDQ
jgi:hypothetical protein